MSEAITDSTPVEIGKFYYVNCAILKNFWGKEVVVPIIGKLHNDAAFGFDHKHYHVDGRFTSTRHPLGFNDTGKTNTVVGTEIENVAYRFNRC